ncbi:hypothetical protein E1295_47095 [Nonomuraea mesophila]|uniref:Uncharacterized protein n=1 Tax=Nonomuraea mesophila TaxID=2530382 RepID=A0A4R5E251_9ACTN|nr:hypothetical protein [Nonomuraea mesophila]TDE20800.1 hypothetical protein E1295_47095 [Nonomuraea mesophila]
MTLTAGGMATAGPIATTNGTVTFIDDMNEAAAQANKDVAAFSQYLTGPAGPAPNGQAATPGGAAAVGAGAAVVSAASSVSSTILQAALLGVNIANMVLSQKSTGSLEITITNNSTKPLTLYNYRPSHGDITNIPNPLYTGQTDAVVLTKSSAFDDDTSVELQFCIGDGQAVNGVNSLINFALTYAYTDEGNPGRWSLSAAVDGSDTHSYPQALQMFGFTFVGNTGFPAFSVYTSPIETGSGSISMVVYDH